jgi:hypothetical protein
MSNLVEHARRELDRVESDPWMKDGLIKVIQAFADMGHSGGSASVAIPLLNDLLRFKNLSPLTDDPDEWIDQTQYANGKVRLWQNKRNSEAFSVDGGKTYYLLSENEMRGIGNLIFHEAEESGKWHASVFHSEDDHSTHGHVAPSSLGGIVDSPGHD